MNIFGIGTAELVLIILIMLVVAGPQRMVRWAYTIGQYVGKLRQMWEEVVDVMQKEADAAGLDVKIPKEPPSRQNLDKWVRDVAKPYSDSLQQASDELTKPLQDAVNDTRDTVRDAQTATTEAATAAAAATSAAATTTRSRSTKPLPPRKPPEGALARGANGFGSWGQASDAPATDTPTSEDKTDFGAWSNPQRPGTPTGEAE